MSKNKDTLDAVIKYAEKSIADLRKAKIFLVGCGIIDASEFDEAIKSLSEVAVHAKGLKAGIAKFEELLSL